MTSTKQIGRIGTFTVAIGAGLLIAGGAGSAVASASPGDSDHSSTSSASASNGSSARGGSPASAARKSSGTKSTVSTSRTAVNPAAANSVPRHLTLISTPPTVSASRVVTPSAPRLPTPVQFAQAVQSALESFGRDINRVFGIRSATVASSTPSASWNPQPGDVIYGNIDNAKYWQNQGNTNTCVLMSTAMVIGQLTGTMPSQQQIVAEAEATTSPVGRTGTYEGTDGVQRTRNGAIYQSINNEYVYYADSLTILYNHKITASATYYTNDQSDRAISDLEAALGRGDSVIVTINSAVRNSAISRRGAFTGGTVTANHAVTVIAVNATQGTVYINDTALDPGQGNPLEMSVADFVAAWKPGQYTLITARLTQPGEQATGPAEFQLAA
jgi:hypothetical protein